MRVESNHSASLCARNTRMDLEGLLAHCLAMPGAWRDEPWEDDVVAKVDKKIFAFLGDRYVGVKCGDTREEADEWLHRFPNDAAVMAYIGRSGWNTLALSGAITDAEILEAIDESYMRVVEKLPKVRRPEGWEAI